MKLRFSFLAFFCFLLAHAQADKFFGSQTRLRNLTERWELDTTTVRSTFVITPYKPIYLLPARYTDRPNGQAQSGSDNLEYINDEVIDYNIIEAKFQFSFKAKIFQGLLGNRVDVWGAYTQVSHWQLYNNKLSRPFREVNYEPEIIVNVPLNFKILGFRARMAGASFNHQSNGKSLPYSRSWNRVIFHAGFERRNWTLYIRPWIRLKDSKDDNPDISKFIGRSDVNVIYTNNGNVFSLIASNNFGLASRIRGNLNFAWSHPLKGNLKGYLLASHGYGETLIDYNYRQTTIGVGVSLIEWL